MSTKRKLQHPLAYWAWVALMVLFIVVGSKAEAARYYTLTACAFQPENLRYSVDPIRVGKITSDDVRLSTSRCQTVRYKKGTKVLLHARGQKERRGTTQGYFQQWLENGKEIYWSNVWLNGAKANACGHLGDEPVCALKMDRNRYVAGIFGFIPPREKDTYLYEYEEGPLPLCKIIGVDNERGTVTCSHDGYTWDVDRNGRGYFEGMHPYQEDIWFTGLNCTGDAYGKDGIHNHLYRTSSRYLAHEIISFSIDYDEPGNTPPLWSVDTRTSGCVNLNEPAEGLHAHEIETPFVGTNYPAWADRLGGSWSADRGVGIGLRGQYPHQPR